MRRDRLGVWTTGMESVWDVRLTSLSQMEDVLLKDVLAITLMDALDAVKAST